MEYYIHLVNQIVWPSEASDLEATSERFRKIVVHDCSSCTFTCRQMHYICTMISQCSTYVRHQWTHQSTDQPFPERKSSVFCTRMPMSGHYENSDPYRNKILRPFEPRGSFLDAEITQLLKSGFKLKQWLWHRIQQIISVSQHCCPK